MVAIVSNAEATRVAQAILSRTSPTIIADGWWGKFTNDTFLAADAATQSVVRSVLQASRQTPESLFAATRSKTVTASAVGDEWLDQDYCYSLCDRAATMVGIDLAVMRKFLLLEAARRSSNGKTYFNSKSVSPNGLYRGLFQMGAPAWADVQKVDSNVGSYSNVFDPWLNSLAAARYVKLNMNYALQNGYKGQFTPEVLYTMHNQGAGGFMRILREKRVNDNVTNQSRDAQSVIRVATQQNGVALA